LNQKKRNENLPLKSPTWLIEDCGVDVGVTVFLQSSGGSRKIGGSPLVVRGGQRCQRRGGVARKIEVPESEWGENGRTMVNSLATTEKNSLNSGEVSDAKSNWKS